jgi:hypothetical protein
MDAPRHHGFHQRTEVLIFHRALVFVVARVVGAEADSLILQIALAALVADRAVQRVVDEQKFHHATTAVADHGRVGVHDHALADRIGAGSDRFRRSLLHFDQAHAAVAGDRQAFVVTEARDFDPGGFRGLQNGGAGGDFDFDPVDGEFRHVLTPPPCARGSISELCRPRYVLP